MATSDPVGTALWSIGAGATTGAAVLTAGVLAVRILQAKDPTVSADVAPQVLSATVLAGLVAAVVVAWCRTRALPDPWRRGVAAAVSVFGATLLAVAATAADTAGGSRGLAAYAVVLVAAAGLTHREAGRAARR